MTSSTNEGLPSVDVRERAGAHTGNPQVMNTRLFMQLWVFRCGPELNPAEASRRLYGRLAGTDTECVVYEDAHDPRGIGLLTWSEDPADFVSVVRPAVNHESLGMLSPRPEMSMFGRTYSSGFEPDLRFWLLDRPRRTALEPAWPWAVWYPLRRGGDFARLEGREQGAILKEHALIGRAYGEQDLAHDIRLACHGLDTHDNDFVIGLLGKELHPLSHVVQSMRKTRQTSQYITQMGPFFVGRAIYRHAKKPL